MDYLFTVDNADASYPEVELDGRGAGAVDVCTRYVLRDHPECPVAHVAVTVVLRGAVCSTDVR